MNEKFKKLLAGLDEKYRQLISMPPVTISTIRKNCPKGGVYLFTEKGKRLYAGRTKRKIEKRLKNHIGAPGQGAFLMRLTCKKLGIKANYMRGEFKNILKSPRFQKTCRLMKDRIRKMEVQYVGEQNPKKQALLEIYVAVASGTKYNDFTTS